jgi:hypothetical protein
MDTPVHREFFLVSGLNRPILREALNDLHSSVKLSVDELVTVHCSGFGSGSALSGTTEQGLNAPRAGAGQVWSS